MNRSNNLPLCECEKGYYSVEGTNNCKSCSDKCAECSEENYCTKCQNPLFRPPFCKGNKTGFFKVIGINIDVKLGICEAKCASCENSS